MFVLPGERYLETKRPFTQHMPARNTTIISRSCSLNVVTGEGGLGKGGVARSGDWGVAANSGGVATGGRS